MADPGPSRPEQPSGRDDADAQAPDHDTTQSISPEPVPELVPEPEPPQWERVLWRQQPFPDNYVPPTFLAELDALREIPPRC